ncbi:non-ribosomal peptide synthetase, partial [Kordiimonas aquimaris]|uniref:non-ribosomal peptide synthetase n=1 Tax=Kordiimonas aquimaris TaxID=707591 RepID=UPI0021D17B16
LPLLSSLERDRLLIEWNDTSAAYASDKCLHTLFEEQASRTPDNIAVVYEGSELSYAELNKRSNQLAHYLIEQGVKPDSLVGLCLDRSLEMVVGIMGILKAGGAYVPLDPDYPEDRLRFMLDDTQAHIVIGQASIATDLSLFDERCQDRPELVLLDEPEQLEALSFYPETNPDTSALGICSDHLAYVIYTSGSTGKPKGVCVEHKSVGNRLLWMQRQYPLSDKDIILQKTPYSFDVSVWEFFWFFLSGAKLTVARSGQHWDTDYLSSVISSEGVTVLHFVPPMLGAFLSNVDLKSLSSLRHIFCSGEALNPSYMHAVLESGHSTQIHNLYGPTEASIDVSYWDGTICLSDHSTVPIGRPISNTQLYV